MYDSPLEWCPVVRSYVELDQSRAACAAQHQCGAANCPLEAYFRPSEPVLSPRTQLPQATR